MMEEEEEEALNANILSSLREAVFLVFLQFLIMVYALWKPPVSEALIKKLDELLAGVNFPLSQFEGIRTYAYDDQDNMTEVIEQDKNLSKRKRITMSYDAKGNMTKSIHEWIELEKGE